MSDDVKKQLEFTAGILEREAGVKRHSAEAIRAALEELERLRAANAELLVACEAYNQWEADLILSQEAWDGGMRPLPQFTQELWDRLLEIQGMRNAAVAKAQPAS